MDTNHGKPVETEILTGRFSYVVMICVHVNSRHGKPVVHASGVMTTHRRK